MNPEPIIYTIPLLNDNYSFIIQCPETKITACVDPATGSEIEEYLKEKNLKLDYILNTHHHFDHVGGNIYLKEKYNAQIVGYKNDAKRIPGIDIELEENQIFKLGHIEFKTIFIPGHTLGHIAYYNQKYNLLFLGDTLFSSGCGRLFEGTPEQMYQSLEKIKNLPSQTKIYCAHEYTIDNLKFALTLEPNNPNIEKKYQESINLQNQNIPTIPTNLKSELLTNPFLRTINEDLRRNAGKNSDSYNIEVFAKIRKMKDNF
jgi:hydroxyacylglutathione hydrolase